MMQQRLYRIHTIQTNGALIKEYVTNNGAVFAVSWKSIAHPNLSILLGAHYQEFNALATSQVPSRGRAPSLPQGLSPEELL